MSTFNLMDDRPFPDYVSLGFVHGKGNPHAFIGPQAVRRCAESAAAGREID